MFITIDVHVDTHTNLASQFPAALHAGRELPGATGGSPHISGAVCVVI